MDTISFDSILDSDDDDDINVQYDTNFRWLRAGYRMPVRSGSDRDLVNREIDVMQCTGSCFFHNYKIQIQTILYSARLYVCKSKVDRDVDCMVLVQHYKQSVKVKL